MSRRFLIRLGAVGVFSGGSVKAVLAAIEREEGLWKQVFENLRIVHPESQRTFNVDYGALRAQFASMNSAASSQGVDLDIERRGDLAILPRFDSLEGRLIRSLIGDKSLLAGLAAAIWVENGWEDRNIFSSHYQQFTADCAAGRAVLATSRIRDGATQVVSDIVGEFDARLKHEAETAETHIEALNNMIDDRMREVASLYSKARRRYTRVQRHSAGLVKRSGDRAKAQKDRWDAAYQHTHEAYIVKLQFEAPATLWQNIATTHERSSNRLFYAFFVALMLIAASALYGAIHFGSAIAELFHTTTCLLDGYACVATWSAHGPLTVAAILLCSSLAIWALRMVNRIHISKRNLAQAAKEKKAFVETYLALTKEGQLAGEQAAIVLGAIFRPSSDGFVSDDSSSVDISAAAVLAKVLSGAKS